MPCSIGLLVFEQLGFRVPSEYSEETLYVKHMKESLAARPENQDMKATSCRASCVEPSWRHALSTA